jgi:hypothetical protein
MHRKSNHIDPLLPEAKAVHLGGFTWDPDQQISFLLIIFAVLEFEHRASVSHASTLPLDPHTLPQSFLLYLFFKYGLTFSSWTNETIIFLFQRPEQLR